MDKPVLYRIMKRLLSVLLITTMLVSLTACGAEKDYFVSETSSGTEVNSIESNASSSKVESKVSEDSTEKISSTFKTAMDSYEKFMNDYVDFMKKYKANPTDISLLSEYADYISKYTSFMNDFNAWQDKKLNTAELAYYIEVQTRVSKKLLEVA